MKLTAMMLSLTLAGAALAAENTLTDQEVAAGWKLLFDGKTTAGWRSPAKKPGRASTPSPPRMGRSPERRSSPARSPPTK